MSRVIVLEDVKENRRLAAIYPVDITISRSTERCGLQVSTAYGKPIDDTLAHDIGKELERLGAALALKHETRAKRVQRWWREARRNIYIGAGQAAVTLAILALYTMAHA